MQFRLPGALYVYAQAGAFADEVERVCHVALQCRLKNKGGCFREIKHFKGATAGGRCKNKAWVLFREFDDVSSNGCGQFVGIFYYIYRNVHKGAAAGKFNPGGFGIGQHIAFGL